jgi:hypothetical protein
MVALNFWLFQRGAVAADVILDGVMLLAYVILLAYVKQKAKLASSHHHQGCQIIYFGMQYSGKFYGHFG